MKKFKKFIAAGTSAVIIATAGIVPEAFTGAVDGISTVYAETADDMPAEQYTYEITPLLSPFNSYFYVKTDDPEPDSFRFSDKESAYGSDSVIEANKTVYMDVIYEDSEDSYNLRINGGYIFKSINTDGGMVTLQKKNGSDWQDTDITMTLPVLYDCTDYLIHRYADKTEFFDNMDAVQEGFSSICLYKGASVRNKLSYDKDKAFWGIKIAGHIDQFLYIMNPYSRSGNAKLLASDIYPFLYNSKGFPSVMMEVSKRLNSSAVNTWDPEIHALIDVTYNGQTKKYGGQGNGGGQALTMDKVNRFFRFDGTDGEMNLDNLKQTLLDYGAMEIEDDFPRDDQLTCADICHIAGDGIWARGSNDRFFYFYKIDDDEKYYEEEWGVGYRNYWGGSLGVGSDTWVDGRYIDKGECWRPGEKFDDHPESSITVYRALMPDIKYEHVWDYNPEAGQYEWMYKNIEAGEINKTTCFSYNGEKKIWTANINEYNDIAEMAEMGLIDEKYLDMVQITPEEVAAMDIDKNADTAPDTFYIYDMYTEPGTKFDPSLKYGDMYYVKTDSGEIRIIDCDGSAEAIEIPSEIDGMPVTSIGGSAFRKCYHIKSVKIPDTIGYISPSAFAGCSNLTEINIPKKITSINAMTFKGCSSLEKIKIPDNVTSINYSAFSGCSSLKEINIPESVTSMGHSVFYECTSLEKANIPDTITDIPDNLFYGCKALKHIDLPENTVSIGETSFGNCTALENVKFPEKLVSMDNYAFHGCTAFTDIELPGSLLSIGEGAFNYCTALKCIVIPENVQSLDKYAFRKCYKLTEILILGKDVKISPCALGYYSDERLVENCAIYGYAGSDAEKYASKNNINFIPISGICGKRSAWSLDKASGTLYVSGSGSINDFENGKQPWSKYNSKITTVSISDSITSIGKNAFAGMSDLDSMIIGSNVDSIGEHSVGFNYDDKSGYTVNKGFTLYVYPDTKAQAYAKKNKIAFALFDGFCGDHAVWHYDESECILSIMGKGKMYDYNNNSNTPWFYYREDVKSLEFSDKITYIGNNAFCSMRGIKKLDLPEALVSIGSKAFFSCKCIPCMAIPENVRSIGDQAFFECDYLKYIIFTGSDIEIGENALGYSDIYQDGKFVCSVVNNFMLYGCTGSSFEKYASDNGITFCPIDGRCGDTAAYRFDSRSGVFSIYGKGAMWDYENGQQPWYEKASKITSVSISEDITYIGIGAFAGAADISGMIIGKNIESIGEHAFGFSYDEKNGFRLYDDFMLYVYPDSAGHEYAKKSGIDFMLIDGTSGDNIVWYVDRETYTLFISGNGEMEYNNGSSQAPWKGSEYSSKVNSVVISDGITSVKKNAFSNFKELKEINMADSVTVIGESAFGYCSDLESITIPENITSVGSKAFINCYDLNEVRILNRNMEIGDYAFGYMTYYSQPIPMLGMTIYGYKGSTAEKYASENDIDFVEIESSEPAVTTVTTTSSGSTSTTGTTVTTKATSSAPVTTKNTGTTAKITTTRSTSGTQTPTSSSKITTVTTKVTTTAITEPSSVMPDIPGDANGDGILNVRDAAYIAKMLAQGNAGDLPPYADFNGDGKINVRDAAAIAKYLASGRKLFL